MACHATLLNWQINVCSILIIEGEVCFDFFSWNAQPSCTKNVIFHLTTVPVANKYRWKKKKTSLQTTSKVTCIFNKHSTALKPTCNCVCEQHFCNLCLSYDMRIFFGSVVMVSVRETYAICSKSLYKYVCLTPFPRHTSYKSRDLICNYLNTIMISSWNIFFSVISTLSKKKYHLLKMDF